MSDTPAAPQPVDPYAQANAQLGLSEGTAQFNAALNRTNQTNPLGSSTFSAAYPSYPPSSPSATPGASFGLPAAPPAYSGNGTPINYPPGYSPNGGTSIGSGGSINIPGYNPGPQDPAAGAPTYTQNTQLAPQFNAALQKPIDTSQIIGAPGGGSVYQGNQAIQDALYKQQTAYLDPQFAQSDDQLGAQLAGQGIMPGSTAYKNAMDQQNRNKTFAYNQAGTSAITGATGQEAQLQGMGIAGLNANIGARNAPINEFESLLGQGGGSATAQTPDISGAFGQQYQGALAGYNANVSSNNATTSDVTGLVAAGLLYF